MKYKRLTDSAFELIKNDLKVSIDSKAKEKTLLENRRLTEVNPE
jgi:hypothetical protein